MRADETVPYYVQIREIHVLEALERYRRAGRHPTGRAAVLAAILAVDPARSDPAAPARAGEPQAGGAALEALLDVVARVQAWDGAAGVTSRRILDLATAEERGALAEAARVLCGRRLCGGAQLEPRELGAVLRAARGRVDARGRKLVRVGQDRTGSTRWRVA